MCVYKRQEYRHSCVSKSKCGGRIESLVSDQVNLDDWKSDFTQPVLFLYSFCSRLWFTFVIDNSILDSSSFYSISNDLLVISLTQWIQYRMIELSALTNKQFLCGAISLGAKLWNYPTSDTISVKVIQSKRKRAIKSVLEYRCQLWIRTPFKTFQFD